MFRGDTGLPDRDSRGGLVQTAGRARGDRGPVFPEAHEEAAVMEAQESARRPAATVSPGADSLPPSCSFREHVQPVSSMVDGLLQNSLERFVPAEFRIETSQVHGHLRRHSSPFSWCRRL